jgi:hypothetical protein
MKCTHIDGAELGATRLDRASRVLIRPILPGASRSCPKRPGPTTTD